MLNHAGRHTAPFHWSSSKHARRELAHLIGLIQRIVLGRTQIRHFSPAHSSRSLMSLIQVHADESARPPTGRICHRAPRRL